MYCTYCNHPNADENRFCENCGKPLVRQQVSPVPAPTFTPATQASSPSKVSWSRRLASVGSVFVIFCFFLPWLLVSCSFDANGDSGIKVSGYEITTGNYKIAQDINQFGGLFGANPYQQTPNTDAAYPLLAIIPLLGALGLISLNGRVSGSIVVILAGLLGMAGMVFFSITVAALESELQGMLLHISYQAGYWGTWLGFIWQVIIGIMTVRQKK